jgi:adenine-specific DNA-methyltransferase
MTNINENKFYQALENIFVGANIEGGSGYVNLMKIKSKYYKIILEQFKKDVDKEEIITDSFKEEFFDRLYSFFEKYFSESGSVYFVKTANWQRVYEQVYTDNKDVVLFWKTHMLYYVKSDILFQSIEVSIKDEETKQDYIFYFDVGTLQNKQNNEKKQIVFTFKEQKIDKDNIDLINDKKGKVVYFFNVNYSENGKKTNSDDIIKKTNIPENVIEKAFKTFKKQSEVDFFINKNAKKFLTEQLDMYLHQILLDEDNKFEQERLNQLKIIKTFANKIIKFISQFEDELVKVWNKPKFALNSNYVITIDKLTEEIIEKISKHENLHLQIKEWYELGMVEEKFDFNQLKKSDLFQNIDEKFKYLPIDTKYFKDFELEVLSLFNNLDETLDGRLIHSENYQALNTLQNKYKEKVQCIYIDPPFNTGSDFAYIDGYQDSSWLSIMNDRIEIAKKFLRDDGSFYLHLDRYANYLGRQLLNYIFGEENYINEIIWRMGWVSGYKTKIDAFVRNHDTIFLYAKNKKNMYFDKLNSNIKYKTYPFSDFSEEYESVLRKVNIKEEDIRSFNINIISKLGESIRVYPSNKKLKKGKYHVEDTWNCNPYEVIDSNKIKRNVAEYTPNGAEITQKPEEFMERIISLSSEKNKIIMDFFTGSGTTISTAHKLERKWIGVEANDYFDTDIIVRMKWVLNGKKVGVSKKINFLGGGFFKYYKLEQYEDTLRNMKYKDNSPTDIFNISKAFEQYIFHADQKFAHVLEVNKDKIELDFDNLYQNIDFAETISNLLGLPIAKITKTSVILESGEKLKEIKTDYKNMNEDEKVEFIRMLRPLLWWGE